MLAPDLLQNPPNLAVWVKDRQNLPILAAGAGGDGFFLRFVMRQADDVYALISCGHHKLNQGIDIPRSP